MDHVKIGPFMPTKPIQMDFGFIQKICYLFASFLRVSLYTTVLLFPVDNQNPANNPKKRNSPLNICVEEIRVEIPFEELCPVLHVICKYTFCLFFLLRAYI